MLDVYNSGCRKPKTYMQIDRTVPLEDAVTRRSGLRLGFVLTLT